jgi:hypothetical protein
MRVRLGITQVIEGHEVHLGVLRGDSGHLAANTAEAVNTKLNLCHNLPLPK